MELVCKGIMIWIFKSVRNDDGLGLSCTSFVLVPDFAKVYGIENIAPAEEWVNILGRFISSWRMPLFFSLSGFFAILVIERKGISQFLKDRLSE